MLLLCLITRGSLIKYNIFDVLECSSPFHVSALLCFSSDYFCSSTSTSVIYLGLQSQQQSNPNAVNRTVTETISHPKYDSITKDNDICLLKLSSPVNFTDYILPVCLAASGSTFYNGTDTWVTGWGNIGSGGGYISSVSIIISSPFCVKPCGDQAEFVPC
uniref:Peptidase S1 domain-containing protein n=1 Tax=Monopterus albus TaxID=43700 RepID=A0A3Q3IIX1_MONAL